MAHRWVCVGTITFAKGTKTWLAAGTKVLDELRGAGGFTEIVVDDKTVTLLVRDWRAKRHDALVGLVSAVCEAAAAAGGKGTIHGASYPLGPSVRPDEDGVLITWKIGAGKCAVKNKSQRASKLGDKELARFEPAERGFLAWLETHPEPGARVTGSGLVGYVDATNRFAIAPQFPSAWEFSGGRAVVRLASGGMHLINTAGELVTKEPYAVVGTMREGRASVTELHTQLSGYVDDSGELVVRPRFKQARPFCGGVARAVDAGGERFVARDGELLVDRAFQWTSDFSDGVGLAWDGKRWFAYDVEGRLLFESSETSILPFSDGLAPFRRGDAWGFLDRTGAAVIEPRFEEARGFSGGRGIVKLAGKLRLLDPRGELVGAPLDWSHESLIEGRMRSFALVDGALLAGYLSADGALVIPHSFDTATNFAEGLAAVAKERRWGFIDGAGRWVVEPRFDDAKPFVNGLASVKVGGAWGAIDRSGALVIPAELDELGSFGDGLAAARMP